MTNADAAVIASNPSRDAILSFLRRSASLTGLDGCVILNKDLELLHIGSVVSKIETNTSSTIPLIDERGTIIGAEFYTHRGTPHRAAVRFCENNAGAIVFLISQDGDIRAFIRQQNEILFIGNLTAWQRMGVELGDSACVKSRTMDSWPYFAEVFS
jgi:hypothetical protein